jgi:hypothetical protein
MRIDSVGRALIVSIFIAAAAAGSALAQDAGEAKLTKPRLGEIMTFIQVRHAKLWFAGQAANWELADFELEELKESIEDAAKFYPKFKELPLGMMAEAVADREVAELDGAIKAKNRTRFAAAFDRLTAACNGCHQAVKHGFIAIVRPSAPPFSNQSFAPPRR